jgi:hypothetical protein
MNTDPKPCNFGKYVVLLSRAGTDFISWAL